MIEKLKSVLNTLDTIKVEGYENMYKIVGCMQYVDQMIKEEEAREENKAE